MWSEFFTPAAAAGGGQAGVGAAKSRPGPGSLTQNFPPEHCRRAGLGWAGLGWAGLAAVTVSRVRYITTGTECGTNTAPRLPCHTGSSLARVGQRNQHDHVHPMGRISATLARPCQQWQPAGAAFLKHWWLLKPLASGGGVTRQTPPTPSPAQHSEGGVRGAFPCGQPSQPSPAPAGLRLGKEL